MSPKHKFLSILSTFCSPIRSIDSFQAIVEEIGRIEEVVHWADRFEKPKRWFKDNPDWLSRVFDMADLLVRQGAEVIYPGHDLYAKAFYGLLDPPVFLSVKGNKELIASEDSLTLVGSRKMSDLSRQWIERELSGEFPYSATVSGGARGVDQCVHINSVMMGIPTVVVLPCPLSQIYPRSLSEHIDSVLCGDGAVVSEFAISGPVLPGYFHLRNRLLAALGSATVVVQAGMRSGTVVTAQHAAKLRGEVFCVSSHPVDQDFRGNQWLISEGAEPISSIYEIKDLMRCN